MSTSTETKSSDAKPYRYRPQHWLMELKRNDKRERMVLLEGNKRNIAFYIRKNTKYLMPFYEVLWKMTKFDWNGGETEMGGKMLAKLKGCDNINPEIVDELLADFENEELMSIFDARKKMGDGDTLSVSILKLPIAWNTRPRRRPGKPQPAEE